MKDKLNLRENYRSSGKLRNEPVLDVEIWDSTIQATVSSMDN
jgi:hypothetical protein